MNYKDFAEKIIELKNKDLILREKLLKSGKLNNGYNAEMENLHHKNAEILENIIDKIGYPTSEKVGKIASDASWLVIQHAISKPLFMKKCATLLEIAVNEKTVNPKNLAYLTDRIAILESKPQLYGTQFDWNENGELAPNLFDDLEKVNQRRKSIGLNSLEEQTAIIRNNAKTENLLPPKNLTKKNQEYEVWRKKVGWII